MISINQTILAGNLIADLELKKSPTGIPVLKFCLAVKRKHIKKGEQSADFINCVAWNKSAEYLSNYAHKGDLIYVRGETRSRSWIDKEGKKNYAQEVVAEEVQLFALKAQAEIEDPHLKVPVLDDDMPF